MDPRSKSVDESVSLGIAAGTRKEKKATLWGEGTSRTQVDREVRKTGEGLYLGRGRKGYSEINAWQIAQAYY